jgi:hypothetical protein
MDENIKSFGQNWKKYVTIFADWFQELQTHFSMLTFILRHGKAIVEYRKLPF